MPSDRARTDRALKDILHHLDLVDSFMAGLGEEATRDPLRLYAIIRCLEIISEASRRLPDGVKQRHGSISWTEMAAAGNVYRHEYEQVSARRVWRTLRVALRRCGPRSSKSWYANVPNSRRRIGPSSMRSWTRWRPARRPRRAGADGLAALLLADAAEESARTGG